jgi:beta-galactosidase
VIAADGRDLAFVTVRIVDEEGVVCPSADHHVHIEISEGGELVATGNGDPNSLTPFTSHIREVFNGLALAIVRAMPGHVGELRLRATAEGLSADEVAIASKT